MGYKEFAASILGKFGGNKNKQAAEPLTVYAPFGGSAIAMEQIPDPVFSEGILGKGCGLEPAEETVCAPFNGTVTQVIDTKHAVGVTSKDGLELLIHVGMDTVAMNGEGFTCLVKEGDTVKLGQKLMTFSMEAIKRSVMDLANMNQFDPEALQAQLMSNIKPDPVSGTVDITYPLVSKGGDQIELSAGWGQTGIVGRVGLKFTNFSVQNLFRKGYKRAGFIPQGDGQTLQLNVQTNGTYYQNYSLSFLEPWLGGKRPNQLSFSIFYSKQSDINSNYYNSNYYNNYYNYLYGYGSSYNSYNYDNYYDPDKYVKMLGVSLGFGKRLRWPDDYFTFMAELSYTRYMLKAWQYFLITDGNCNNVNLSLTLSRSSTNHPFFPTKGSELLLSVTATPPYSLWDGKDYKNLATNYQSANYQAEAKEKYRWIEYNKWKFKFRSFTGLMGITKTPVLMTRVEFGILGSYNRYKKSPFEAFYVGGDGTSGYSSGYATETIALRGYDNGSLAGSASSNAYAYSRMTLELRYPVMMQTSTSIYALAFLEGGNAWTNIKDFNPFDMKRSAGVGVRILLPMVGLLGVDWAYGFQKYINGQKVGGSQFHFIIGQEF